MKAYKQTIKGLILDMDGVLWIAKQPIGDLKKIFSQLQQSGYRFVLATNNSSLSIKSYLRKLGNFGALLQDWQIITSSQVAAEYLWKCFPNGGPVYVIGEEGLIEAVQDRGFTIDEQAAQAVIVGRDTKLTFQKLVIGFRLLEAGRPFIGTNLDKTFPTSEGLEPGTGSILAILEESTQVKPHIVGKPFPEMYQIALSRLKTIPQETLVVGDRLETDIVGAQKLGCLTGLVLSGVTNEDAACSWKPPLDFIAPDLGSLLDMINS
jgi:4-nitrophenyl phosphatase